MTPRDQSRWVANALIGTEKSFAGSLVYAKFSMKPTAATGELAFLKDFFSSLLVIYPDSNENSVLVTRMGPQATLSPTASTRRSRALTTVE